MAGKFFTKRVLNVDVVARTFKPLWRPRGELKIRDMGGNILLFEFEDCLDLERVLELEPWSYDKHLVVFQRTLVAEAAPLLDYSHSSFWIQIHNVPNHLLTPETGESVGRMLGRVIQVADPEDDGAGGEFLRVRLSLDISRRLPRCCKLRANGNLVGWVGLKYERLLNYCYWCDHVSHGEKDCEMWLRNKGRLRKEDQQYGEWLWADSVRAIHKSVATIPGAARSKVPWQKQSNIHSKVPHVVVEKSTCFVSVSVHEEAGEKEDGGAVSVLMNGKDTGIVNVGMVNVFQQGSEGNGNDLSGSGNEWMGIVEVQGSHASVLGQADQSYPLVDTSSGLLGPTLLTRAWKRLAREVGKGQKENNEGCVLKTIVNTMDNGKRRISIDLEESGECKKQCMDVCDGMDDQSFEVVAAWQHHRALCGLGNPQTEDELVALMTTKDPIIVFLMETKVEKFVLDRIGRRIHFANLFLVPRVNSSGGLALFWKSDVDASVQTLSECHIDVVINQGADDAWRFTGFYGDLDTANGENS